MGVRLNSLVGMLTLATAFGVMTNAVIAQEESPSSAGSASSASAEEQPTILQQFEDTYYRFGENFFRNRQTPRNITWFLGPFPENEIAGDGRVVHRLYVEVMTQQVLNDPIIRTADLTNPFDTSLLLLPTTQPAAQIPQSAPFVQPPVPVPPPVVQPAPAPVRGLY